MGGSESRCCTDVPQEKKPTDERNFTGDFDGELLAEKTKVLQFDPRSPSQDIDRTPIEVPVQTKPLMRVQPMIESNLRNRHVSNENRNPDPDITRCHDTFLVDPRSPGPPGCRTPISSKQGINESSNSKPSKIVYPESVIVDPRSPSQGIVRTPLLAEEELYEDPFMGDEGAICETPKKSQGETNQGFTTDNDQERDPRSPSQGVDRTPVSKVENPDHRTDVVSARNMHDPRSPTTDVSRTPLGALFAGHRELRRTVLMTNALMASPMNKKIIRQDSVDIEDKDVSEPETVENVDACEEDEIPAILCCNFDPLNNSCSSSMVASIGSEVDCISLNESFEGLISTTDTADIGLMESLLQNINDIALEEEIKEQYRMLESGYMKFEDVETPRDSRDIPISCIPENSGKEWDKGLVEGQCNNDGAFTCEIDANQLGLKVDDLIKPSLEENKLSDTVDHEITDNPHKGDEYITGSDMEKKSNDEESESLALQRFQFDVILDGNGVSCTDNDIGESQVSHLECETKKHKEKSVSSDSEEKQIDEIVSDLVSMADDSELINHKSQSNAEDASIKSTDANEKFDVIFENTEDASIKFTDANEKFDGIFENTVPIEGDELARDFSDVFESCENEQKLGSRQSDDEESTKKVVSSKEESADGTEETLLSEKLAEPNSKIEVENNFVSASDKKESTKTATQSQEKDKGSKKPSRKLKSPSKVSNHKKFANTNSTEMMEEASAAPAQVGQSASIRKPSMIRKPKAKSASSDDSRVRRIGNKSGEGQENKPRSIKILSARKSDSKLVSSSSTRSPLAVLTNDLNSPISKRKPSNTTQMTKLPRYQGTPPIANNRSLSVSFSGGRSTKRSQSGERPRNVQRSFHHEKEN